MAIVLLAPILPQLLAEFRAVPGLEYWVPMILTTPAHYPLTQQPHHPVGSDQLCRLISAKLRKPLSDAWQEALTICYCMVQR